MRSPAPTKEIVCDSAVTYGSLRALGRAASSVAVLAPTAVTRRATIDSVPFTITRVKVLETIGGKHLAATIRLRQTGAPGVVLSGSCEPLVSSRQRYLAYLTRFRLRPAGPPVDDQYFVVGGSQGLFELQHPPK